LTVVTGLCACARRTVDRLGGQAALAGLVVMLVHGLVDDALYGAAERCCCSCPRGSMATCAGARPWERRSPDRRS
jgi:hypothetical protein